MKSESNGLALRCHNFPVNAVALVPIFRPIRDDDLSSSSGPLSKAQLEITMSDCRGNENCFVAK